MFEQCDRFLKVFLSMSFSGTILILALLVGKRFWQDKISRQWQYYIWLVVILRLLLPFAPEWNLMETARGTIGQVQSHTAMPSQTQPADSSVSHPVQENENQSHLEQENKKTDHPRQGIKVLADLMALFSAKVWLVWLAVALGLLIRKITMYQRFVRCIRAEMTPIEDAAMLERLSAVEEQAGVKRPIELCSSPFVSTPMLMGLVHSCIVLPSATLPERDFYYIALHELMHHKRRDILYKWLVELSVCMHWFNPAVYWMRRELSRACEFSCDAAVLAKVGRNHARDYGKTLLDAMAAVRKYRETVGAVLLSENKQLLKERLGAVMNDQKKSGAAVLLTGMLTLGMILGTVLIGVYPVSAAETATFAVRIEQYYQEGSIPLFQIAFSQLDAEEKAAWIERIYADGQISFLGCAVNELEADSAAVLRCAEKAYADRSTASFSVLAKRMSEKTLKVWLDRALADQQYAFQSVLFGLLDDDRLDALEEEMDRQLDAERRQEYLEHGIYGEGKNYYYESQLVHIFLDIRKEGSFYFLEVNPQGTVDIKVTRDENGGIQSVGYMTQAEVEDLFGDMEEAEEEYTDEICTDEEFMDEIKIADDDKSNDNAWRAFDALKNLDAFKALDDYADAYKFFGSLKDTGNDDAPQIITVNEQHIAAGTKLWFGDYDLRGGDRIQYHIEVETGDAVMVGFINNEDSDLSNATYHSVLMHREDGVLRCSAEFIRDASLKDGNYKFFIYAPEGALGNVKGTVSIAHVQ